MPWSNVMPQFKSGNLHSGSKTGPVVKNRKQAIAILLSEKKKSATNPEYAATPPVGFAGGGVTSGMDMLQDLDVDLDQVRVPLDDGGTTDDSQVTDQSQDQTPSATVRAMYYGSAFGEHNRDANVGPAGNELQPYDVAISPALAKSMGLGLGDWIQAYGRPYRVADWSYKHPGEPTQNSVEFRDHPADGHTTITPLSPDQIPTGEDIKSLARMAPPEDTGPAGVGGFMAPMPGPGDMGFSRMQAAAPDIQDPFSSTLQSTIAEAPQLAGDMTAGGAQFGQSDDGTGTGDEEIDPDTAADNYMMKQSGQHIDLSKEHVIGRNADGSKVKLSNGMWLSRDGTLTYQMNGQQYGIPPGGNKGVAIKPKIVKSATGDQFQQTGPNTWEPLNLPGDVNQAEISKIKPGDINSVPESMRATIQAYADNRLPMSTMSQRSPYMLKVMQAINKYDPNYDSTKYKARQALMTDISSSGKFGSNLVSFDTALDHAGQLLEDSQKLNWGGSKLANAVRKGYYDVAGGHDPTVAVDTTRDILAPEAARAMSGAAPDQTEINNWNQKLSATAGFDRHKSAVIEIAKALDKKAGEINARYKNAFGTDTKVVSDQSLDALHKIYNITKSPEIAAIIKKYEPTRGQPYVVGHADSKGFQELAVPPPVAQPTPAPDISNG